MSFMNKRKGTAIVVTLLIATLLVGCEKEAWAEQNEKMTKVVLTAGFREDEIFRIEKASCTLAETMVYLTNTQNQYENIFGEEIFQTSLKGKTLESNIKDTVLARLAQIKTMNLLAQKNQLALDEKGEEMVKKAAEAYVSSLNEIEKNQMGISYELIEQMYREYATAHTVYQNIIKDINPEISDDEARTITVQYIQLKAYTLNGQGEKVPFSAQMRDSVKQQAVEIEKELSEGADFEHYRDMYSESKALNCSFRKGEMDKNFEDAAFLLGNGEISSVVETADSFYLIKCLNTFNREETDVNKIKIVEERKKEVFNQEYDKFVDSLIKKLNDELWESVALIHDEEVTTSDFFQVYDAHFLNEF